MFSASIGQWILSFILIISSLGVILARQPVHASLSFLGTLLTLAIFYIQLSAEFTGVMQILIYAGAILVIFMFVIILFQDAHQQIEKYSPKSSTLFLFIAAISFLLTFAFLGREFIGFSPLNQNIPHDFGTIHSLGKALYTDFFFPFEAVVLIFLIALIGALYVARKVK